MKKIFCITFIILSIVFIALDLTYAQDSNENTLDSDSEKIVESGTPVAEESKISKNTKREYHKIRYSMYIGQNYANKLIYTNVAERRESYSSPAYGMDVTYGIDPASMIGAEIIFEKSNGWNAVGGVNFEEKRKIKNVEVSSSNADLVFADVSGGFSIYNLFASVNYRINNYYWNVGAGYNVIQGSGSSVVFSNLIESREFHCGWGYMFTKNIYLELFLKSYTLVAGKYYTSKTAYFEMGSGSISGLEWKLKYVF